MRVMPFEPARPSPVAQTPPAPPASRSVARIIWSGLAAAITVAVVGVMAIASVAPPPPGSEELRLVLLAVAVPFVAVDLAMSYVVTARMRRTPPPGGTPDSVAMSQTIVGAALAVGATLMCCVFYFVSREPLLLSLVVPCVAVLVHWFPSQSRWLRLAPAGAPPTAAEPTRRPMVRG